MARTYRALAALLSYPTEALQAATGEIAEVLAEEGIVPARHRAAIDLLLREIATTDIYELQERYFALFDRSRTLSLHLFEHIHGESRDRGQAMADLIALYAQHGLEMTADELPDFLPLFLEFLSLLPRQRHATCWPNRQVFYARWPTSLPGETRPISPSLTRWPSSPVLRALARPTSLKRIPTTSSRWMLPGRRRRSALVRAKRWMAAERIGCAPASVRPRAMRPRPEETRS